MLKYMCEEKQRHTRGAVEHQTWTGSNLSCCGPCC